MNIAKLKKLKKFILAEPRRYRQEYWLYGKDSEVVREQKPPCGTAGCLAGCAVLMEGYVVSGYNRAGEFSNCRKFRGRKLFNVEGVACEILEIPWEDSSCLFDLGYWYSTPRKAYLKAETSRERAKAAAMQLDFVIKKQKGKKK